MIKTYDEIMNRMLSRVPNDVDKRPGSIIWDALAPAAAELAQMYIVLEHFDLITYADKAEGDYLTLRCAERGVFRKEATKSLRKAVFDKTVPIGARFALNDTTYIVVQNTPEYQLQCEQAGTIGNLYFGELKALDNIEGLKQANLTDVLIPGEDTENDESLRVRYFDTINGEAFGGNIADYKVKVKALNGVGGVKVYPVWNGGGTVKLVVIDSNFEKPHNTLIQELQTAIDPVVNQGEGIGLAPIGHIVTVEPVIEEEVTVSLELIYKEGYTWEDVNTEIVSYIKKYLQDLSKEWDSSDKLVVRASHIDIGILGVTGVLDVTSTLLNNSPTNLILDTNSIPKFKEVVEI